MLFLFKDVSPPPTLVYFAIRFSPSASLPGPVCSPKAAFCSTASEVLTPTAEMAYPSLPFLPTRQEKILGNSQGSPFSPTQVCCLLLFLGFFYFLFIKLVFFGPLPFP